MATEPAVRSILRILSATSDPRRPSGPASWLVIVTP